MNINDAFPSQYLKADDLGTSKPVVTISHVEMEEVGEGKKPVLYFQGKARGMVLNKTNKERLVEFMGSTETDDWAGKRVRLVVEKVDYAGKRVPAIRIHEVEQPKTEPVREPGEDDIEDIF
ncbi:MAG TPA: hypothetical protein PLS95_10080 [Thermoanaerobaculales bacterium]|nr:hypothetical protein [Thermoanaerobaculales bacterium]